VACLLIDQEDVLDRTALITTNDTIDYTRSDHAVAAAVDGNLTLNSDLGELYLNFADYLDLNDPPNRKKFITADGNPVYLGAEGRGPTGNRPAIYMWGDSEFEINVGSGGDFGVTAAFTGAGEPLENDQVKYYVDGLDHLIGEEVIPWLDGGAHAARTVDENGAILITRDYDIGCFGLGYSCMYQSTILASPNVGGTAINQMGRPTHIGFLLAESVQGAIEYGTNFSEPEDDPINGLNRLPDRPQDSYFDSAPGLVTGQSDRHSMPGESGRDVRLCIRVKAPYPVTIQGIVLGVNKHASAS
jgi:hypothetical protein